MLTMEVQLDVICCKSVGTDLSMLDIEDFITEICQLKKEVASLEAKLRERGDKLNKEVGQQMQQTQLKMCSVKLVDCRNLIESRGEKNTVEEQQQHHEYDDDGWIDDDGNDGTEAQDSVWRSRYTQDSELSHTLLCYADAQDHGSADETSDCNAGEQQMVQMCSVKLVDCRNLIESRGEKNTAKEQQQHHEDDDDWIDDDENDGTETQDSVWRSRDTQDSELSHTLLCYTDAQNDGSADEISDCNAGEQQMQQTQLKMCSVRLVDCKNLIESREEKNRVEEQQQSHEDDDDDEEEEQLSYENDDDDDEEQQLSHENDDDDDEEQQLSHENDDDEEQQLSHENDDDDEDYNIDDDDDQNDDDQNDEDETTTLVCLLMEKLPLHPKSNTQ
ncbi:protein PFC0760c-like isoform X2 [Triplophysa rosa]|uniref:protein PFC0760c-like isoform X2 n=1 Tax=Triplophysa rosa TaxID=992332 RepID=UPI00254610DD|nr:protein PFC0760c-like isoform X2 [Triplophysa rosa]